MPLANRPMQLLLNNTSTHAAMPPARRGTPGHHGGELERDKPVSPGPGAASAITVDDLFPLVSLYDRTIHT